MSFDEARLRRNGDGSSVIQTIAEAFG